MQWGSVQGHQHRGDHSQPAQQPHVAGTAQLCSQRVGINGPSVTALSSEEYKVIMIKSSGNPWGMVEPLREQAVCAA